MMRWAILVLLLIPMAAGQINGPRDFEADYGFADASGDGALTIVSGKLGAQIQARQDTWGFLNTQGMQIIGPDVLCHRKVAPSFEDPCIYGDFTFVIDDGSGIGIKWPNAGGTFASEHTFGFFATASGSDLNSLVLNESLVAPSIDGAMSFTDTRAPDPSFLSGTARLAAMAAIVPLFEESRIVVYDGEDSVAIFTRSDGVVFFAGGGISVPAFAADTAILPFTSDSTIKFSAATAEAAREGIRIERIQEVQRLIAQASEAPAEGEPAQTQDNPVFAALSEILDAALVHFPIGNVTKQQVQEELSIVLFDEVVVTNDGGQLTWEGEAAFQYQSGQVAGAQPLHGVWYLQLPWWGWLLWVVAIGAFVARMVVQPEKRHERWDRYRWVGWLMGLVAFAVVFFLWDLEMRSVWGTSVLSTNTSGTAFWITFGLQMATMAFVLGAVAWPLSILTKNTLLLARQGTMMGLGKPLSLLVTYLLGATLFLSYMELLIQSVMENI